MKRGQWLARRSILLAVGLALAGCGGGGGGGDDGGPTPVQLTPANAQNAAADALGAVTTMSGVADFGAQLVQILGNLPPATRTAARSAAVLVPGVCDQGTVDVTITDTAPVDVISVGDVGVLTFSGCLMDDPIDPTTFNGAVTLSVTLVSSGAFPLPPFDITFAFAFSELTVTDSVGATVVRGGFDLTLAGGGDTLLSGVTGTSLSLTEGASFATLSNFGFSGSSTASTGAYTQSGFGRLASSDFGGNQVGFETTTPFAGIDPDYPHQGVLVVDGASGSRVTVTAVSNTTVEMALDANGDGVTDTGYPISVLWDDLDI